MAYDFPASPTPGQTVTFGSTTWQWNGTAWLMQSGNVGPQGPPGDPGDTGPPGATGPAGPAGVDGEVEEAPTDGQQYARQSATWAPFTIPDPAPAVGLVDVGDTPPPAPIDKQFWFKSNQGSLWLRYPDTDGSQWLQVNAQPVQPAVIQTEQFINMAGLTQADVTVPTWARGAVIDGSLFMSVAAGYAGLQISIDGTTFIAGTNYTLVGGTYHNVTGGYGNQGAGSAAYFYLSYPKSNLSIPHIFQTQLSLESNVTSQLITVRSEAQAYDNTSLGYQMVWQGYYNQNLTPPARVQKLRILTQGGGSFVNGYVKIKWLGDSASIPAGNAIADSPQDGGEYVRVNGVWRLKSQTFNWTTQRNTYPIICPPGATRLHIVAFVANAQPQASGNFGFQGSQNGGSTWNNTSGAYYRGGFYADNPNTVGNVAIAANTYGDLTWQSNNVSVGNHVTADICLVTQPGNTWTWHSVGGSYFDTGAAQRTSIVNGYMSAGWGAGPINALLFFNANSNMYSGTIECTWGYG